VQKGDLKVDVCIIGAGFTGLSAALNLAQAGTSVAVLDAQHPGWGASGRNGGFCCLGGARISDKSLVRQYGSTGASAYWKAERNAVDHVADVLDRLNIDADVHSKGETELAHQPKRLDDLKRWADTFAARHGVTPDIIEAADLGAHGMHGPFHGAATIPIGFALNPRKYLDGVLNAVAAAGAQVFQNSPALRIEPHGTGHRVRTPQGTITCTTAILATNGYSSEDLPDWMAARYMPTQSNVMVTRPITPAEQQAQGWTSTQMSYDTRNLLHYFRLMPDGRFLFGMRGGLTATPGAEDRARRAVRRDFHRMFPAWSHVEASHFWSGMVCLSYKRLPFAGEVPGHPGLFAGLAYHGNGVAMGSYTGHLLAQLVLHGSKQANIPTPMSAPLPKFPLGRARRAVLPVVYAGLMLGDI
jgi:glycine/D-amino acid oxidase-like deaminating enzyme